LSTATAQEARVSLGDQFLKRLTAPLILTGHADDEPQVDTPCQPARITVNRQGLDGQMSM
jgi:hypothetical protein